MAGIPIAIDHRAYAWNSCTHASLLKMALQAVKLALQAVKLVFAGCEAGLAGCDS